MKMRTETKQETLQAIAQRNGGASKISEKSGDSDPGLLANAIHDLLWETLHSITGSTGRDNNPAFIELYLQICEQIAPRASFEIGAREANFSRKLKVRCPQTTAYAFEANPYIFERFRHTIEGGVTYLNEAIGSDALPKPFFIPLAIPRAQGSLRLTKTNPTSSLKLRMGKGVEYESVVCKCDTLDAWHERLGWPTSALWIDVEGAVGEVIQGAVRSFESCVQCVFVELEKTAGWKDQWLALDVVAIMKKFGFQAVARDCETPWQYNQIFVRERAMKREIVRRVGKYVDQLLGNSQTVPQGLGGMQPSGATVREEVESRSLKSPSGQYPDRTSQVSWLVERKLLSQEEAEHLLKTFHLPRNFEERVLTDFPAAEGVPSVGGIKSELVIAAAPAERFDLPCRTFDGPYPPLLASGSVRYLPIELHVARTGKIFIGLKQTTLMLDKTNYYAAVSKPASRWITPVFAGAAGELKLQGTAAILFANGATHFSHWMFDLLPKIEVLRRAGWTDNKIDYYIVNAFRTNFQKETFDRLGIPHEKVVPASGTVISADCLLIPTDIRMGFRTPPWVSEFIRALFRPASRNERRPENRRLHISRAEARRRKILNEEEIEPVLQKHGFKTVFAEKLTIAQCAELVCQAAEIFAPHGAGATNAVFGSPGIRLLESYSAHIAPEGWLLTHSLGGRHYLLAGQDKEGRFPWQPGAYEGFSERERNYADYLLRPSDIERALEILTAR